MAYKLCFQNKSATLNVIQVKKKNKVTVLCVIIFLATWYLRVLKSKYLYVTHCTMAVLQLVPTVLLSLHYIAKRLKTKS